jgi:DNA-binding PadR family transcriptional regulator
MERAPFYSQGYTEGGTNLISSDVIRGYNDTIILFLLLKGESYGYEISKNIKELSEEKYIMKETTLYSAFDRLQSNGYIESFYGDESFGKRRTYYRITPRGLEYYKEKCEEWALTKDVINRFIKEWNV